MIRTLIIQVRGFFSYLLLLLALLQLSISHAQWHDANWVLGYTYEDTTFQFSFTEASMAVSIRYGSNMWLPGLTHTISDSMGKLQFYTNGARVADSMGALLDGGDTLMMGNYIKNVYYQLPGTLVPRCLTIFPWPGMAGRYAVVYGLFDYRPDSSLFLSDKVYCRVIDMNQGTNGAVLPGQDTILSGSGFEIGQIVGTKHANGRDWWLLIRENASRTYQRLLLTPEGWRGYPAIEAGESTYGFGDESPPNQFYAAGDVLYTPDGSKHIRVGPKELYLFDFDRCTGELSNSRRVRRPDVSFSGSVAVSPNSRYLYWCTSDKLFQYDLQDTSATMGEVMVAAYTGQPTSLPTNYIFPQLAPDGKIYINGGSSTSTMHVIMQPDSPGVACTVVQDAITFPGYASGLPNYPNYRLGPVPGGGCDSTPGGVLLSTLTGIPTEKALKVWPNPAREQAMIALPEIASGELRLLAATGAVMKRVAFSQKQQLPLDLTDMPAGVYVCEVRTQEGNVFTHKLMILP